MTLDWVDGFGCSFVFDDQNEPIYAIEPDEFDKFILFSDGLKIGEFETMSEAKNEANQHNEGWGG